MKEELYLTIPEPCHEDWNKMTPVERGRHCAVCKKDVVDFTNADNETIINFFKNYNGNACGQFNSDQLNRPLTTYEIKPVSAFLKYAAGLLLPGLMLTKANGQQKDTIQLKEIVVTGGGLTMRGKVTVTGDTVAQMKKDTFPALRVRSVEEILAGKISCFINQPEYKITGNVVDERDGSPLYGVAIIIVGTKIGTITDINGNFTLHTTSEVYKLKFSYVGYEFQEVTINSNVNKTVSLRMKAASKGGMVGYISTKRKRTIATSLKRIKDTVARVINKSEIKVFPNPVTVAGTVHLQFVNSKTGLYQIYLLNETGQLFYSFQKQISSPNETEQIHLNAKMSAGVYVLQIIDDKKRLVQTSKIVVQ